MSCYEGVSDMVGGGPHLAQGKTLHLRLLLRDSNAATG